MRLILLLFIFILEISAQNIADSDFDGVPDEFDKCPDTEIFAIVDRDGCPTKKLVEELKEPLTSIAEEREIHQYMTVGYLNDDENSYFLGYGFDSKNYSGYIESGFSQHSDKYSTISLYYNYSD